MPEQIMRRNTDMHSAITAYSVATRRFSRFSGVSGHLDQRTMTLTRNFSKSSDSFVNNTTACSRGVEPGLASVPTEAPLTMARYSQSSSHAKRVSGGPSR